MLELFGSGLISLWLDMAGVKLKPMQAFDTLAWQTGTNLVLAPDPNPARINTIREYLKQLQALKLIKPEQTQVQGIWMQSGTLGAEGTKFFTLSMAILPCAPSGRSLRSMGVLDRVLAPLARPP